MKHYNEVGYIMSQFCELKRGFIKVLGEIACMVKHSDDAILNYGPPFGVAYLLLQD